jgi:hypothetical protein
MCYQWAATPGMPESERNKQNPTVNPTETTTYTVSAKNIETGEDWGTSTMTVFVVKLEIVLYKPKVIAGNTTTPADPSLGAQTFVNLDNDDNDTYYDNDAQETNSYQCICHQARH